MAGLISIPMAAYSEEAGNGPTLQILWAQYNRVAWVPEVRPCMYIYI